MAIAAKANEKTWSWFDKANWAEGLWKQEPDKIQWTDPATQMPCLMVRNKSGVWCGYAAVAEGHPWFALRCTESRGDGSEYSPEDQIDIHGGLSFSNFCQEDKEHGICHIPEPGQPDRVWWFGFDCAHGGDLLPTRPYPCEVYRDMEYVKEQVTYLALQLSQIKD